jgi:hypothetical protein
MTDTPTKEDRPTWKPRKVKGKGTGKPAPVVVFSGDNILVDEPPSKRKVIWKFDPEVADKICELRATGLSLRSICARDGMPDRPVFYRWREARPELQAKYARACDDGDDAAIEERLDRLRDPNLRPEDVQREWRAFDGVKWYVSKTQARKYGDRLDVRQEISGPGGGPIQAQVLLDVLLTPANLDRLTDIEVESIRSAAAKLALPAPSQVIDAVVNAVAEPVIAAAVKIDSECSPDAAGELDEDSASSGGSGD